MPASRRADILNINFFDWSGERRYMGGAERYVLRLAALLRELGYAPRLLQNATRPFVRKVGGVEVVGVLGPSSIDFDAMSRAMAPQVADAALVIASPVELACALPEGPRVIGISHGIWWDDPAQPEISGTMGREPLFRALGLADAVVCVDSNFEHWVSAVGASSLGRLVHIANAVDVDEFACPPRRMEGPLHCLFPRRLCHERGFDLLEPAFERVWAASPGTQLHICGAGAPDVEARARSLVARSAGRARWSELTLDDMPLAYREADVALIPTVFAEGTSLSCLEAMASGNAVIATRIGGLSDLVIDGFNGLAIDADAAELAEAVLRLDRDRALARNLASRGRDVSRAFALPIWEARWRKLLVDVDQGRVSREGRARGRRAVSRHASFDAVAAELSALRDNHAALRDDHAALVAHSAAVEADRAQVVADLGHAQAKSARLANDRDELERRLAQRGAEVDAYAAESLWQTEELAKLRASVASHVTAIDWLQGELCNTIAHYRARQRSPRALVVDVGYTVLERVPPLRAMVRAMVPAHTRERVSVARSAVSEAFSMSRPVARSTASALTLPTPAATTSPAVGNLAASPSPTPLPASAGSHAPAAHARGAGYDVFCFANVAWATRYQRPHHLMRRMADDGHRVFYIVASRVPEGGAPFDVRQMEDGIYEVSLAVDRMQNMYGEAMSVGNVKAMGVALEALIDAYDVKVAISIVHLTYWVPLVFELREAHGYRVVYDCMDEWADFPNIGQPLLDAEQALVEGADLVTVTAALLEAKFRNRARRCLLVRNGVDFAFFAERCIPNPLADGLKHPIIGYYGALAEWVDFGLIAAVARAHPEWTFVLVGDVFVKDLAGLDTLPNVKLTGRRPYEEMPQYLYHFDVCLVPFVLSDVTHAVDPVKFYEYLSVGKPVVTVPLEELAIYRDYAYFAEGPEAFGEAISRALVENDAAAWQRRMALARDNDWDARHAATAAAIRELHPKVSIVVISFDNVDMTRACVESIFRNTTWPNFELIIVDNASGDETRVWLRHLARTRPEVRVIFNADNRGFAAANNQGIAIAEGEYYVLLNNDTIVPRGWLEPLLARLDDPAIGLVGPVTNFVGNEAKIEVDYRDVAGMEAFAARWMKGQREDFDIAMLAMFCVAIRRATWDRIGPLDESFGTGMFEDDDYSRRVQATGLRTVCVPASFVHHFGQASFKKLIATGEYDALWKRNQAIYEQKWGAWTKHEHRREGKER